MVMTLLPPERLNSGVIFSVLNGLSNPTKALKEIGPYAIYINELGRNQESPLSEHLRNNEEEMKNFSGRRYHFFMQ
jgi:hypothetical protein